MHKRERHVGGGAKGYAAAGLSILELLIAVLIILIIAALTTWAFVKVRAVVRSLDPQYGPPAAPALPTPTLPVPARTTSGA
jgi:hypothetical protein